MMPSANPENAYHGFMTSTAPPLPGGVGVTRLRVYDWPGPDGLRGGSPHVHLACTEAYLVTAGRGSVQTLGPEGFAETPLEPGVLTWFTPGLVHRLVNHGELEIVIVMQIATLPEAGDCILSFPEEILSDRDAYHAAAAHDPRRSVAAPDETAARSRRDLAVEGFNQLRERIERDGPEALERFHAAAARIAMPLADAWRAAHTDGPAAAATRAGELITALEQQRVPDVSAPTQHVIHPAAHEVLGVCGRLRTYPHPEGVPVTGAETARAVR
jgi:mannose-6-phosphate isomerase-like protein (cupin superfamily)